MPRRKFDKIPTTIDTSDFVLINSTTYYFHWDNTVFIWHCPYTHRFALVTADILQDVKLADCNILLFDFSVLLIKKPTRSFTHSPGVTSFSRKLMNRVVTVWLFQFYLPPDPTYISALSGVIIMVIH